MTRPHEKRKHRAAIGIDSNQALARTAAGMGLRISHAGECLPDGTPKPSRVLAPIVALECEACGCLNAKVLDYKRITCEFCGAKPRAVGTGPRSW